MHCKLISVSFQFLIWWIGCAIMWMDGRAWKVGESCPPASRKVGVKELQAGTGGKSAKISTITTGQTTFLPVLPFLRRICGKVLTFASEPRNNAEKHEVIIIRSARHRKQRNRPLVTLLSVSESLSSSSLSTGAYTTC